VPLRRKAIVAEWAAAAARRDEPVAGDFSITGHRTPRPTAASG